MARQSVVTVAGFFCGELCQLGRHLSASAAHRIQLLKAARAHAHCKRGADAEQLFTGTREQGKTQATETSAGLQDHEHWQTHQQAAVQATQATPKAPKLITGQNQQISHC